MTAFISIITDLSILLLAMLLYNAVIAYFAEKKAIEEAQESARPGDRIPR